jgi:glycerophosphoryl diester phosphodiesterase
MTALDGNRLLVIERDFLQGEKAQFDKVFVVDLRREDEEGFLVKREVVDLLDIRDPEKLSLQGPVRPGDFGLGDPFEFPYITTESVLPVGGNRLAVVNDNNFGGVGGRNPSLPDYTDFVLLKVDGLRGVVEKGDD